MFDTSAFVQGFVLGLGMFVCPGPKDVLILRQALLRRSALGLISVGVFSDALLIGVGMAGASVALSKAPHIQMAALWLGVCLLVVHGALSAKRAAVGAAPSSQVGTPGLGDTGDQGFAALLSVSLLNPIAWLDTLLVIGAVGASLPDNRQLGFAAGAVMASLLWFLFVVLGARQASQWMSNPHAARLLDAFVAVTMSGMAVFIAVGLM
jgi:L-lysine exporter family protein LysE/ArgO